MSKVSDYDLGWQAWLDGAEYPPADASDEWRQGFFECADQYPDDNA